MIGGGKGNRKDEGDEDEETEETCATEVAPDLCNCFGKHSIEQYTAIKGLKGMLAIEIDECVRQLKTAMIIGMIAFAYPFQVVLTWTFSVLTRRVYIWRPAVFFDILVCLLQIQWLYFHFTLETENDGYHLTTPPRPEHMYMKELLYELNTGSFPVDLLLGAAAFCFWVRLILMLQLTSTFGPLITIIFQMFKDLGIFFVLFSIELIAFSCIGLLSFGSLPEYRDLVRTLIMMLETSMGAWDLTIYDSVTPPEKRMLGKVFHLFVMCVNMLLLLNLIIAIMTDTYAYYNSFRRGLFSRNIIEAVPSYQNDKRYGALISAFPPFNLISIFLLPIMLCIREKGTLKAFNLAVCKVIYFPMLLLASLVFFIASLLMVPLAYGKMVIFKFKLYKGSCEELTNKCGLYILIGLPMLLIGCFTDLYWFVRHSYVWDLQLHVMESQKYPSITLAAFNKFYRMVYNLPGDTADAKDFIAEVHKTF